MKQLVNAIVGNYSPYNIGIIGSDKKNTNIREQLCEAAIYEKNEKNRLIRYEHIQRWPIDLEELNLLGWKFSRIEEGQKYIDQYDTKIKINLKLLLI